MAFPVGTPVNFQITSDSVMNSFFIPQLGGQIYAMAGMQTQLHLIADEAGDYAGISANFSGTGFLGHEVPRTRDVARRVRRMGREGQGVAEPARHGRELRGCRSAEREASGAATSRRSIAKLFHNIIAKYNNGQCLDNMKTPICRTKG